MKEKTIYIYTDGACRGNQDKHNRGGYAALLCSGKYEKKISGAEINTTNNIMEMKAVIEALKLIKDKSYSVMVFSDSAYVVNCINDKWYVKWRKNGWINSKKEAVLNKELWEELIQLVEGFCSITFIKVKGHLNVDNKAEIKKWYGKLSADIRKTMSLDEYIMHIQKNIIVDELATREADSLS